MRINKTIAKLKEAADADYRPECVEAIDLLTDIEHLFIRINNDYRAFGVLHHSTLRQIDSMLVFTG